MRMGMVMPAILKLVTLCVIVFALALQGSTGLTNSPSPTTLSVIPLVEVPSRPSGNGKSFTSNPPSSESRPIGSFSPPELAAPPFSSPPEPLANNGLVPASPPSSPISGQREVLAVPPSLPLENAPVAKAPISMPIAQDAPPPAEVESHAPTVPPSASGGEEPVVETPSSTPVAPVATPSRISPAVNPSAPATSPPSVHQSNSSDSMSPVAEPITPVTAASPPLKELGASPPAPGVSSPSQAPQSSPFIHPSTPGVSPSMLPDHAIAPVSPPPPITNWENETAPVAAPSNENPNLPPPMTQIPALNGSDIAPAPSNLLPKSHSNRHPPTLSPSTSFKKPYNPRNKFANPTPAPSYPVSPPTSTQRGGLTVPPSPVPVRRRRQRASPPRPTPLTSDPPISSPLSHVSPTPAPSQKPSSGNPKIFPSKPPSASPKSPFIPPIRAFPPPPPNEDCSTTVCTEPYANTPPGSPCGCVLPIQVGLRLSVSLYTFFPLVSQLAQEIAAGVFIKQSQVRIIGANAANQQTDKTVVLVDLVPLGEKFDNTGAFFIYQRFWNKQVAIQKSFFGDYEVLYVRYPGLPESPPSSIGIVDDGPFPGANNSARKIKPLGVDLPKDQRKNGLSGGVIAVIVLSASLAVIFCSTAVWIFLFRRRDENFQPRPTPHVLLPTLSKPSGGPGSILGSRDSSATLSFGSSIATYTGSARTFSASDIEKATEHFDTSRVLGEGGFGRVYSGVLEDGTKVAVKVLKRDDQQGGREFLAEVEMLSRLHHRNLVKLIGICIEDRARCLVYELIPNGSVDSHLHGVDKESARLNWGARVKIALGAARGLAYLHEDSSPRVIHRDFKSSNILLEDDFTPKVSDFGLARTALDEENRHISTRVMGTFGYVAPEYAMTGHLLVKSDVYSYGVVLLELLTGRIPVDMSQPPGQENLVAWARPLLAGQDGLDMIIDRSLGPGIPLDSAAKVAAIASMCVQPEVSNRPFMGEVVQALKLVCNEIEEEEEGPGSPGGSSRNGDDLSIDVGPVLSQYSVHSYDELGLFGSASARLGTEESESFRRHSSSWPIGGRRSRRVWERVRTLSGGSISDGFRLRAGSN